MITKENIAILLGFILGIIIAAGIIFFIIIGFSMIFGIIPPKPHIEYNDILGPGEGVSGLQGGYTPVNYTDIQESRIAILERINPQVKKIVTTWTQEPPCINCSGSET